MTHTNATHRDMSWTLVLGLILMLSALLAGCGPDDEEFLVGDGEFELTGDANEELACKVRWESLDLLLAYGNEHYEYQSPGIYCGELGEPVLSLKLVLWKQSDGSYPEVSEGTYSPVNRKYDCPEDGPPCAAGYMKNGDDEFFTLPDEGEFTITSHSDNYVAGEVDLLFGNNFGEDPDKTIRLTGTFDAKRR